MGFFKEVKQMWEDANRAVGNPVKKKYPKKPTPVKRSYEEQQADQLEAMERAVKLYPNRKEQTMYVRGFTDARQGKLVTNAGFEYMAGYHDAGGQKTQWYVDWWKHVYGEEP